MTYYKQLEEVLVNQIQMLNDDSLCSNTEESEQLCKRMDAINKGVSSFCDLQRTKLEIVKTAEACGSVYNNFIGIEEK